MEAGKAEASLVSHSPAGLRGAGLDSGTVPLPGQLLAAGHIQPSALCWGLPQAVLGPALLLSRRRVPKEPISSPTNSTQNRDCGEVPPQADIAHKYQFNEGIANK